MKIQPTIDVDVDGTSCLKCKYLAWTGGVTSNKAYTCVLFSDRLDNKGPVAARHRRCIEGEKRAKEGK